ncbi:hypothetical protein CJ672_11265, partial [Arcobacter cryaerophilus gv. occultus]
RSSSPSPRRGWAHPCGCCQGFRGHPSPRPAPCPVQCHGLTLGVWADAEDVVGDRSGMGHQGNAFADSLQNEPVASGRLVLHRVNNLADAAATRAAGVRTS